MIDVFTTGHPKSGNTWLCHLLSDLLHASYIDGGQKNWRPEYWGVGEAGNDYRVTKMHAKDGQPGPTVFIYRDPRDVFTSMWHWRSGRYSLESIILICAKDGRYEKFVRTWWNTEKAQAQVSFEELIADPICSLERVVYETTGKSLPRFDISQAVYRQEFGKVRSEHPELCHLMWTGKTGSWMKHFTGKEAELTQKNFGSLMRDQGYITDDAWMKEIGR